jgi:hypothetical protein
MNESSMHRDPSRLESIVASDLSALLENVSIGSALKVEPSANLLFALELYIPQLLSRRYSEWKKESLDGFFLANARKIGSETAEFAGLCILISDQTVTPVLIRLTLTSSRDSIAAYQVFLGEPGGGHLGISGPPCTSPHAQRLLDTVSARLNNIRWSYAITSDSM